MHKKNRNSYPAQSPELRKMVFASLFAALTAAGAYIEVPLPFSPVPITLQVFFVLLAGSLLKSKWGSLSMLVYALLGIAGLPVFSGGGSGLGVVLGPTGGYITGFILAAYLIGRLSEAAEKKGKPGVLAYALYMGAGVLVIYTCGVAQLIFVAELGLKTAFLLGAVPFLPGEAVKISIAAYIAASYEL